MNLIKLSARPEIAVNRIPRNVVGSMFGLIHILLIGTHSVGQPISQPSSRQSLEDLVSYYDRMVLLEHEVPVVSTPTITFHAYINHKTTLKDLSKIRRRAAKRLGVQLLFRNIQFDNTGLCSILIDARSEATTCQTGIGTNLTNSSDFGIFEISFGTIRQCFIGTRSSWPEHLHLLIAKRS